MYDFADIDRDGMIDMLYFADKNTMNIIINYNMLANPTSVLEEKVSKNHFVTQDQLADFKKSLSHLKKNICSSTNRTPE